MHIICGYCLQYVGRNLTRRPVSVLFLTWLYISTLLINFICIIYFQGREGGVVSLFLSPNSSSPIFHSVPVPVTFPSFPITIFGNILFACKINLNWPSSRIKHNSTLAFSLSLESSRPATYILLSSCLYFAHSCPGDLGHFSNHPFKKDIAKP